jgi:uncharacterized protein (DUF58 family)
VTSPVHQNELAGRRLGEALPPLVVAAQRIAATVMMGAHGLRRAGPGEDFWAYRSYSFGDSAQRIDWRKSARSDETFIRDNEWDVANTLWFWVNRGPRMDFRSHLAEQTKANHAQVLGLAIAALALRAHERVGVLGSGRRASSGPHMLSTLAASLQSGNDGSLPSPARIQRRSVALLVSDFLDEPELVRKAVTRLSENGMSGMLVQVTDPAEETLPYEGRIEFHALDVPIRWRARKTQDLREDYAQAFKEHRETIRDIAQRLGFGFLVHRTDKPLTQTVLALHHRLGTR